jgi:hypothetical protein
MDWFSLLIFGLVWVQFANIWFGSDRLFCVQFANIGLFWVQFANIWFGSDRLFCVLFANIWVCFGFSLLIFGLV